MAPCIREQSRETGKRPTLNIERSTPNEEDYKKIGLHSGYVLYYSTFDVSAAAVWIFGVCICA